MDQLVFLSRLVNETGCEVRLKLKGNPVPELWGKGLSVPVSGYLEVHGPWPADAIEWVELNPVVAVQLGRIIGVHDVNRLSEVVSALQQAGINYLIITDFVRVVLIS